MKIEKLKRTGIYGGSFNPIHVGHVRLAKALVDKGLVDEMWLMVSPQNPFKVNADLSRDNIRLRLAALAVSQVPGVEVCDREFSLPRPSYMYSTLQALSGEHPDREFVLVIGADNWERFHDWYRSGDILATYRIIVCPRPGYMLSELPTGVKAVNTPLLDISSTEIRRQIASNPDYDGEGLPPMVWQEIKEKGYYR